MGLEALYWMPFLAKLRAAGLDKDRLIPISSAGAASWYEAPVGLELYALRSPASVRIENKAQVLRYGLIKQTHVTDWDRAVLKDAAESLGLKTYLPLHPSWMYQAMAPFWAGHTGAVACDRHLLLTTLPLPSLPDSVVLPPQFVAVKFYSRHTLPPNPQTIAFVEHSVRQIAARHPVVLLDWDGHTDDHTDFPIPAIPNVTRLSALWPTIQPETALSAQSAVLARSMGFVGTYGGFAHLALRYQRPVVSYYWEWGGVAFPHRTLSEQLGLAMGVPFHCLRIMDLAMLQEVMPHLVLQPPAAPTQLQTV